MTSPVSVLVMLGQRSVQRLIVGWSMSAVRNRGLAVQSVVAALWQGLKDLQTILHSDRGGQFTGRE